MSVKIRLTRVGRKNSPYFRIAIADSRRARDGRIVEAIGHYQPLQPNDNLTVDEARALYWLNQGALPSDTVRSLLKRVGVMRKYHESKYGPSVKAGHEQYHVKKERPEGKGKKKAAPAPETAPAAQAAPAAEAASASESAVAAPENASTPVAQTPAPESVVAEAPTAPAPESQAVATPEAPAPEAPAPEAPAPEAPPVQ